MSRQPNPNRAKRSPNYPSTGLPEAVCFLRKIYDKVGDNRIPEDTLAAALGYTKDSSWLNLLLSSLVKFGLLDAVSGSGGRPRKYKITETGLDLATADANSPLRVPALRRAALRPPIYQDLWEKFGPQLPEFDDEMASYLVSERRFNRDAAFKMLAHFRSTVVSANLKDLGKEKIPIDAATLDAFSQGSFPGAGEMQTAPPMGKTQFIIGQSLLKGQSVGELRRLLEQHREESDQRTTAIPLADGEIATIMMPKKMSPQSWQMLIDTLELWKKQASSETASAAG